MGKCECGHLKGNPCGPLRPNTINVTMPSVDLIYLDPPFNSKTDYAAPLISKGVIRQDLRPGQAFEEGWVPFSVPDHIWAVLERNRKSFPYTPPEGTAEPPPWKEPNW